MSRTQKKVNNPRRTRPAGDPVLESLRARKMSVFLLESSAADLNEEIKMKSDDPSGPQNAVKNLGEALKLAEKELGFLAALGKAMNLGALNDVTAELRASIAKVELEDAADSDSKGFKQVAYITNGISKARVAVKTTVTTAFSVLKKLGVEVSNENKDTALADLPVFKAENAKITLDAFKAGLVKKLGDSAKGGAGFFKKIANFFGDTKSIEIDGKEFVDNLVELTLENFQQIAESPVIKNAGVEPSAAEQKVQAAVKEADPTKDASPAQDEKSAEKGAAAPTSAKQIADETDDEKLKQTLKALPDVMKEKIITAANLAGMQINLNNPKQKNLKAIRKLFGLVSAINAAGIKETRRSQGDLLLERLNVLAGTSNRQTNRRDK